MKFNKSSQLVLVSAASLLVAGLMTACETLTVDFVFVASSKAAGTNNYGEMDVLEINSESGYMRHIPTSPFPSGGRNPVAEAVSSDNTNLYVVNQDDNSIVQFIIGNDGKLYPQNTSNTPGIYPLAVAVNGTNLFVLDTYQPLPICSTAEPCSGSIAVFPITVGPTTPPSDKIGPNPVANGSLTYWPLSLPSSPTDVIEPTGMSVVPSGAFVYVAGYDVNSSANYIFGFSVASGGALTPLNGGAPLATGAIATGSCPTVFLNAPFVVGTCPSALASDPTSTYLYVTDSLRGQVHGYTIGSTGLLSELSSSPYTTGNQPLAIVADPNYPYVYVANSLDSTVTAFSTSSGVLTSLGTYATGLQPVSMGIDPSTSHFLYTTNYLGSGISGTVSGFELSTTDGTLVNSQKSPYTVNAQPTAIVAIPHKSGTGAGVTAN
ncbi:MAG: beta-propeller fold lactonase family protein [Terracidiphilus sp.]